MGVHCALSVLPLKYSVSGILFTRAVLFAEPPSLVRPGLESVPDGMAMNKLHLFILCAGGQGSHLSVQSEYS